MLTIPAAAGDFDSVFVLLLVQVENVFPFPLLQGISILAQRNGRQRWQEFPFPLLQGISIHSGTATTPTATVSIPAAAGDFDSKSPAEHKVFGFPFPLLQGISIRYSLKDFESQQVSIPAAAGDFDSYVTSGGTTDTRYCFHSRCCRGFRFTRREWSGATVMWVSIPAAAGDFDSAPV